MIASSSFTVLNVAEFLLHYREEDANLFSPRNLTGHVAEIGGSYHLCVD